MKKILICIGCDNYDHLTKLHGATNDAKNIFLALTNGEFSSYSKSESLLILSPSTNEIQKLLSDLNLASGELDTLTFFFAGHGEVKSGSFWMCTRETNRNKLSTTAYSLSSLILFIQEIRPRLANILIDACESGGVLSDLTNALRTSDIGDASTTGISIFAACARNQYALEVNGAGVCTTAVMRCIDGTTFVQDAAPEISLSEIAKRVSDHGTQEQNPVFWGLNVTGNTGFCKNPHYSQEAPLRQIMVETSATQAEPNIKKNIWKIYADLDDSWDSKSLKKSLSQIIDHPDQNSLSRIGIIRQASTTFTLRAMTCSDIFREIEVHATCLACLLPYSQSIEVEEYISSECEIIANKILSAADKIRIAISIDRYALLGSTAHIELFFLPLRLTKLYGWIGAAINIACDRNIPIDIEAISNLMSDIQEQYVLSLSAVSDSQAPYTISALVGLKRIGLADHAEMFCCSLFSSLTLNEGRILRTAAKPSEIIKFLFMRATKDRDSGEEILARPAELPTILLLAAKEISVEDIFDISLIDLDRNSINAFIPSSYMSYSLEKIESGQNCTFRIGYDIWNCQELRQHWDKLQKPAPENIAVANLSMLCSLLYPDRVCWHLLDKI
jgi:hypothetical protein